ncbi:beta-propeller domain-containing protein [Catenulispora yoronensis]
MPAAASKPHGNHGTHLPRPHRGHAHTWPLAEPRPHRLLGRRHQTPTAHALAGLRPHHRPTGSPARHRVRRGPPEALRILRRGSGHAPPRPSGRQRRAPYIQRRGSLTRPGALWLPGARKHSRPGQRAGGRRAAPGANPGADSAPGSAPGSAPNVAPNAAPNAGANPEAKPGSSQSASPDHSTTNTAEPGVDEPDTVKTDGKAIVSVSAEPST